MAEAKARAALAAEFAAADGGAGGAKKPRLGGAEREALRAGAVAAYRAAKAARGSGAGGEGGADGGGGGASGASLASLAKLVERSTAQPKEFYEIK